MVPTGFTIPLLMLAAMAALSASANAAPTRLVCTVNPYSINDELVVMIDDEQKTVSLPDLSSELARDGYQTKSDVVIYDENKIQFHYDWGAGGDFGYSGQDNGITISRLSGSVEIFGNKWDPNRTADQSHLVAIKPDGRRTVMWIVHWTGTCTKAEQKF